ncbi:hypothetical protein F4808DRAFT_458550 [Astrocystis sublimbata]|nr:hypothetical protein F4808DRAFT_458550 [Astrocystis sublimbata]
MTTTNAELLQEQAGLELAPPESGLHPLPSPTPVRPIAHGPTTQASIQDVESGGKQEAHHEEYPKTSKKTVLGLSVPIFWTLITIFFIVLAAGIGGGVGGGLSAQRKSVSQSGAPGGDNNPSTSAGSSSNGSTPTSTTSSPTASSSSSSTNDPLVPMDGGCPGIDNMSYTPYSADGKPIPIEANSSPQEFREQCWTSWENTATTHDILRTYTPTLEQCITVCAEYNKAYARNLKNGVAVGGGPCVAVTIVKDHAGFCYLKNGTGTNNTMGTPNVYSSAILITNEDD